MKKPLTPLAAFQRLFFFLVFALSALPGPSQPRPTLERLDRGLIASKVATGVHLNWRLLLNEVTGSAPTGLTGVNFNLYRNGAYLASVSDSTNFRDTTGIATSQYFVRAVLNGIEIDQSKTVTPWSNANFVEVLMRKPPDHTYPTGGTVAYVPGDMSVGDVDGDGEYEYFVKWEGNPQDVIGKGYTGGTIVDCYKLDGTLLYRIDLGKNIRAGAHYTQFLVYDFDGDGKAELMFKTAPGTATIRFNPDGSEASRTPITMLPQDIAAGWSHADDYRCSYASFADHLKQTFAGWSTHPEVVAGNWPAQLQSCWGMPTTDPLYNLNPADPTDDYANARNLVTYFVDVYAPARSTQNQLRQFIGYIFKGPEYLTIFNGATGAELQTIAYKPGRDDSGLMWGDYAATRIEPCNRVDRLQACVASLDGRRPFAIFARGYYTRTTIVAYSWNGQQLQEYWVADSGYPIFSNPFNTNPHGIDGRNASHAKITTQGAHTLGAADVDGDGFDEIINGSSTIDHDGSVLYSSFATITQGPNTGLFKRLGHGDAIHVTDIDPNRPGLEIFMCHEEGTNTNYGISMRDAKTGEFIWGFYSGVDTGRCMVGDINPNVPGLECWGFQNVVRKADNGLTAGSTVVPSTNQNIKWAADMTTQFLNGVNFQQWVNGTLSNAFAPGNTVASNNGTKNTAGLVADVFGDWREEVILRRTDNTAFRIYFNTDVATRKMFTLMHDRQYRMDVARQNDGYNQPAYTEFYLAADTNFGTLYQQINHAKNGGEIVIAPTLNAVSAVGGIYNVAVNAGGSWTVDESLGWVNVSTPNGSGNGSVTVTVAPNADAAPRSGSITIGGITHTLTQAAATFQAPAITGQPMAVTANAGSSAVFSVSTPAGIAPSYQWERNGTAIAGATGILTVNNTQPANAGIYRAVLTNTAGTTASLPAILGITTSNKIIGTGSEVAPNIVHPNGNIYDQLLLQGVAASGTADPGQVTRISFLDLTDDIVQVEFSGAGTLSLVLDGSSGPAAPQKYNQPSVAYMKGHAGIVIVGADETTNVSVFSVGRANATNQALFRDDVTYDGLADIAFIAIVSTNGKFGGLRTANASYFSSKGLTGIYAPNIQFTGPVFVGDINAFDTASPMLILGAATDTRITGGDLLQTNGRSVEVSGIAQLKFVPGSTSHGVSIPAQINKARLEQNGVEVTNLIVVNPSP